MLRRHFHDVNLAVELSEYFGQNFPAFFRYVYCNKDAFEGGFDGMRRFEILVNIRHHVVTPRGESIGIVLGFLIDEMYQLVNGHRIGEEQITNVPALKPDYHDDILGSA